jgi:hypothetical protein
MSNELKITSQKKLKTINKEFQEKFPYLMVQFFTDEEAQKAKRGEKIIPLSLEKRLSEVKEKDTDEEISIHGNTKVKTLEEKFHKAYGINIQVCYANEKGRYYTTGEVDEMTLSKLNSLLEKKGYMKNPK